MLCSPCTALHRRKRVDTSCSCPQCGVSAMLMHDAMRQGEVVQHGKDCAAWWRTMPHACTMMSARRPQAQAECRKAARAAAAWPRRGRLRSWQARLSQLTWSRRATRRALYERNCESLQELTFSQSPSCRGVLSAPPRPANDRGLFDRGRACLVLQVPSGLGFGFYSDSRTEGLRAATGCAPL